MKSREEQMNLIRDIGQAIANNESDSGRLMFLLNRAFYNIQKNALCWIEIDNGTIPDGLHFDNDVLIMGTIESGEMVIDIARIVNGELFRYSVLNHRGFRLLRYTELKVPAIFKVG